LIDHTSKSKTKGQKTKGQKSFAMRSLPRNFTLSITTWVLCALFLGPFLVYPVGKVLLGSISINGQFSPALILLPLQDSIAREGLRNAFFIGVFVTLASTILAVPLAYCGARLQFFGKPLLTGLLLVPLLLPPFVGAVGLRQLLAREGMINTLLRELGVVSQPIDFLQMAAPAVVVVAALHLYPLIYLNLSAAWANVDSSLEEAAENLGAGTARVFKTVTLPLLWPGFLSGALIVFIFALTDLGTPLVFNFKRVTAVQIFDARNDVTNPMGYVLALWLMIVAVIIFWIARRATEGAKIATVARGTRRAREAGAKWWQLPLIYGAFLAVIALALLPHFGVILASFARDWTSTLLPDWTLENYRRILGEQGNYAANAIKVSLICALASMAIDVLAGAALAYAIVRGKVWGRAFLDTLAMLPLALPGLILAFGLLVGFINTPLNPLVNAIPLLIVSYAMRRLPYALRAVSSGLQQTSVALEEASLNLGASPLTTVWNITRPLVSANLIAAALLTFAFAVLEVSDSLILAVDPQNAPLAKAIYQLTLNVSGGTYQACALGVIGMLLLTATFLLVNRLLGKQLGALFRI
jgi:iron(III) transport system permease protein